MVSSPLLIAYYWYISIIPRLSNSTSWIFCDPQSVPDYILLCILPLPVPMLLCSSTSFMAFCIVIRLNRLLRFRIIDMFRSRHAFALIRLLVSRLLDCLTAMSTLVRLLT
jgi:hypothetical protein